MSSETQFTGGCFCGTVAYEINGALPDARACHCSMCRKAFSGVGSYIVWTDQAGVTITQGDDNLTPYTNKEGYSLCFCKTCGTTVCVKLEGKVVLVTLGSLNGAPDIKVGEHIFVGSKAPWDEIGGDAPQYDEHAPAK